MSEGTDEDRTRGLCFCGCGAKTPISKRNEPKRGDIIGQPVKYLRGHATYSKKNFSDFYDVDENGCWICKHKPLDNGYCLITVRGERTSAHRFSWVTNKGDIPPGMFVLHKCDVKNCMNPDHLFLGTAQDNMDDMWAKGRARCFGRPKGCAGRPKGGSSVQTCV